MDVSGGSTADDNAVKRRLAALIVEALGVGTTKREWDVVDELFAAFGAEVPESAEGSTSGGDRSALRDAATRVLTAAAPTSADLLNEFVRRGGRFIDMLDEVYDYLARHVVTTAGESESFRLRREDLDEEGLTLSPAFIEQVKRLERRTWLVQVGRIDEEALSDFIRSDNGEFFGRWPLGDYGDGLPLADAVLHLAWIGDASSLTVPPQALDRARTAADSLVVAAETLLRGYLATLDAVPADPPPDLATDLYREPIDDRQSNRQRRNLSEELVRFRENGILGVPVFPGFVVGIDEPSLLGLDRDGRPKILPVEETAASTGTGALAGFVAMWRTGRWAPRMAERLESRLRASGDVETWLESVATAAAEATQWLRQEAVSPVSLMSIDALVEIIEEFLNLPLWRQRDFLYEVWIIVATLRTAERTGWAGELCGLAGDVWQLPRRGAGPVARLRRPGPALELAVWHEPQRAAGGDVLTPDLTVTTTGALARDLFVVEAKDRVRMPGLPGTSRLPRERRARATKTALEVAQRYARALGAAATWVCNHCDFIDAPDASANLGDPWTAVHLASGFRPGVIPDAFVASVASALHVQHPAVPDESVPTAEPAQATEISASGPDSDDPAATTPLTVVLDRTFSMWGVDVDWAALERETRVSAIGPFRAVLYTDHGEDEPFLVRKIGPFSRVQDLADAVSGPPFGNGGDFKEALEDALQRSHELVDDIGPHTVLVVTDAPPHPPNECPYGVDYDAEARAILATGSQLLVATDWQMPADPTWTSLAGLRGFECGPFSELLTRISCRPD